ncbi:hypothetical protein AURDEDRAFT_110183 [Auricularia subglabra TFB-10046 SS5]|nr:hypothetical protein AURDEDRAFT_110183 [Auricularia subglabra TFB-10046 SS5]
MRVASSTIALALASSAAAHFTLNYPETRGFDEDKEPDAICGGFNTPSENRTQFPLKNGLIFISSHHPSATVFVSIALNDNPTSFDDFNATTSPGKGATVLDFFKIDSEGDFCFDTDVSALGLADAKDGTEATLNVIFNGGDGTLYQCADVILSSNATSPKESTCKTVRPAPTASSSGPSGTETPGGASGTPPPNAGMRASASQLIAGAIALFGIALAL